MMRSCSVERSSAEIVVAGGKLETPNSFHTRPFCVPDVRLKPPRRGVGICARRRPGSSSQQDAGPAPVLPYADADLPVGRCCRSCRARRGGDDRGRRSRTCLCAVSARWARTRAHRQKPRTALAQDCNAPGLSPGQPERQPTARPASPVIGQFLRWTRVAK